MRILKHHVRPQPRISLILLDWGVRESFHLLHYLKQQTVPRDAFEVILIEYYSGISEPLRQFESEVDLWVLLDMPGDCYYHKHLMYNTGIVMSRGYVVMIADSDAMVRPTFLETVLRRFESEPDLVYHMDEFRNIRRDFYPFNYPTFEEVLGDGCINNRGGKTTGILDRIDPVHTRNYGSCMCARRADLIAIGGADEDLSYLGHVCGPYDMTFRLMNAGRGLCWETDEYLYHTWHPGSDGVDNYMGPHDGKNMSITAFRALCSGRVPPLVENGAIRLLRMGSSADVRECVIDPKYAEAFSRRRLGGQATRPAKVAPPQRAVFASHRGIDIYRTSEGYCALRPHLDPPDLQGSGWRDDERIVKSVTFDGIVAIIDECDSHFVEAVGRGGIFQVGPRFAVVPDELQGVDFLVRTQREDPRIAWAGTISEARRIAGEMGPATVAVESPAMASVAAPDEIAALRERVAAVETAVSDISQSQIWRTFVGAAGVVQRIGKALGLR